MCVGSAKILRIFVLQSGPGGMAWSNHNLCKSEFWLVVWTDHYKKPPRNLFHYIQTGISLHSSSAQSMMYAEKGRSKQQNNKTNKLKNKINKKKWWEREMEKKMSKRAEQNKTIQTHSHIYTEREKNQCGRPPKLRNFTCDHRTRFNSIFYHLKPINYIYAQCLLYEHHRFTDHNWRSDKRWSYKIRVNFKIITHE